MAGQGVVHGGHQSALPDTLKAITDPIFEEIKDMQESNKLLVEELMDTVKQIALVEEDRPQWNIWLLWFLNKI